MVIVCNCLVPIGYKGIPVVTTLIAFLRKFVILRIPDTYEAKNSENMQLLDV